MSHRPTLLLERHAKELQPPTFLSEYGKPVAQCATEDVSHPDYPLSPAEMELTDRTEPGANRAIDKYLTSPVEPPNLTFIGSPSEGEAVAGEGRRRFLPPARPKGPPLATS